MPNRLAQAQSLYLRKHADNPVDWWPWCDEALAAAKRDNKPIFLSIGYSSCHWCTVMEGEAFSDGAIADYLNSHFLPIKVDREERPDIDSIYMQALQMMTGQGGWPLNIFLTPDDLVPFFGGTYFPVDPKYGRPGFLQVLQALRRFFDTETDKLGQVKGEILENLQQSAMLPEAQDLSQSILERGLVLSAQILAPGNRGNSFPMIPYAATALRGDRFLLTGETLTNSLSVCTQRGLELALGGIFDQVAGGFHRYTVDPTWTVPHFEKMLYDNGQIVEYLADLWSIGVEEPAFQRAIDLTVQWLQREMTAPEGYFYAAQDADSFTTPNDAEPEEGAFYVWSYAELETLLDAPALALLKEQFTLTEVGNFEGKNVLQRKQQGTLDESTETALAQLFQSRYGQPSDLLFPPARNNQEAKTQDWFGRIPAVTDTKMIVAWNSLMISGLARAAAVWGEPSYFDGAARAAQFILEHQWVGDRLHRLNYEGQVTVLAQSEDYALLIKALLDLHQAAWTMPPTPTDNTGWLEQALRVQAEFDQWLWSEDTGGYYNTANDASDQLLIRERMYQDNATPAANGVAIANLVKLALLSEDLSYLERAEKALHAFGAVMARVPRACPSLFTALDWFCHATLVRTTSEQLASLIPQYSPTAVFKLSDMLPADTVGMVCEGLFCKAPAKDMKMLRSQLQASQQRDRSKPHPS